MLRFLACMLAALFLATGAGRAAAAKFDEAGIRSFVAEQARAWNARDFGRFYATFAPGAVIVLVTMRGGKEMMRRVRTPAEDRREAERFFGHARARIHETDQIEKIAMAPDGRRAHVRVRETARILRHGRARVMRSVTEQELAWRQGHIVSLQLMEFDTQ